MSHGLVVQVRLRITWGLVLAAATGMLFWLYCNYEPDGKERTVFAASLMGGAGALWAGVAAWETLANANRMRAADHAYTVLARLNDLQPTLSRVKQHAYDLRRTHTDERAYSDALWASARPGTQLEPEVSTVLAYFDDMAIGIRTGLLDEHIARESLCYVVTQLVSHWQPYILRRRHHEEDQHQRSFPNMYRDILAIADAWSAHASSASRPPSERRTPKMPNGHSD